MVSKRAPSDTYKLAELAETAGVSPRTVRYYVQRGLLDAPAFRGKDTEYTERHLATLRAIAALQAAYLPLDEIAARLRGRSINELGALASGASVSAQARSTDRPDDAHNQTSKGEPRIVAHAQWHRVEIAPGLEVHLRDNAARDVAELFEQIVRIATEKKGAAQ